MRYSKRKLKGLAVPKEIKISSLSDYIRLFANGQFFGCFFRGEPTNYDETVSVALRKYNGSFKAPSSEYPFIKMKDEFKREVWHKLNQDERAVFLAFAQHYGIPTNLIDFTKSPLIALYFACMPCNNSENKDLDEERGFVNIVRNKFIDITDIVGKNEDKNILEQYIYNRNNTVKDFYYCFCKYNEAYPYEFYSYFKNLNEGWHYNFDKDSSNVLFKKNFPAYKDGEYMFEALNFLKNFLTDEANVIIEEITQEVGEVDWIVLEYTLYLQVFLKQILEATLPIYWLNCIPNFLYSPILPFERGRNQESLFLYQAFLSFNDGVYNLPVLAQQRIWPDIIIVVENKNKVLKELDFIGINRKSIFCDFDNIAAYIKEKV